VSIIDLEAVRRAAAWCRLVGQGDAIVDYHATIGSTNKRAFALADENAPEGSIVVAGSQTAGVGRLGKSWTSPPGGLYLSLILRPDVAMLRRLPVTLMGGLAVAEAIEATTQLTAELKWPNDVYVSGKKVAGILGELKRDVLVLGIGINIGEPEGGFPDDIKETAASLASLAEDQAPDPEAVLAELLKRFEDHYQSVRAGGGVGILSSASARMPMLGKPMRITLPNRTVTGIASGLNQTGGLVVELEDGTRDVFVAGEVEAVRPK
jgi:BirA family biotin operon repressor/biotin-[acetyl-CoA-carboxylase] ligase